MNNIVTALNTRIPPKSMLQPDITGLAGTRGESCPSPSTVVADDEGGEGSAGSGDGGSLAELQENMDIPVMPRYCQ